MLHFRLSLAFLLVSWTLTCSAQQSLSNDSIVKMVKAGFSDDLIVQSIGVSSGTYSITTNDLISLKQAGVSDKVIGAILAKASAPTTAPTPLPTTVVLVAAPPVIPGITDVGIYYKSKSGSYTDLESENVNFKTGGVLKSAFTEGIIKGDVNGHLTGPASKLQLNTPIEFAIYVLDGQSPGEFQLLHLHTHSNGREFRSETGGVFHKSSGAQRDTISFESKKVAPRTYVITVTDHLTKGEYGFLAPTMMNSGGNLASMGKMYTFGIVE